MIVSYSLTNVPMNGATITSAALHAMVDHIAISNFGATEVEGGGSGVHVGSSPATNTDAFVQLIDRELYSRPNTAVSLQGGWPMRGGFGKTFLAFWSNRAAPNSYTPPRGMPCWVADTNMPTIADFSVVTGVSLTSLWALPKVVFRQSQWGHWWDYASPNTFYPSGLDPNMLWFLLDETINVEQGIVKCLDYGWGLAMVHATLSNSLQPGDLYGIRKTTDLTWFPVSWNHTNPSEVTVTVWPLGIVRRVHLSSGVTAVPFITEHATSMTMVSYYVADVFFGGTRIL
jgi:hypothetical protein